jgi:transcriptional regulator with XRE-family HTH domain
MNMPRPESRTLGYLYDRFIGDDPEQIASYEKALTNAEVATAIHALRTEAGLSQRALAKRVGTTASVICRLEDADYEGHSLSMLRRVAAAVGKQVAILFLPSTKGTSGSPMTASKSASQKTAPRKKATVEAKATAKKNGNQAAAKPKAGRKATKV